jgi:hypothetical protein
MFIELLLAGAEEGCGESEFVGIAVQLPPDVEQIDQVIQSLDPSDDSPVRKIVSTERASNPPKISDGYAQADRITPAGALQLVAQIVEQPTHRAAKFLHQRP